MTPDELIHRYDSGELDFRRANLNGADLNGANLSHANLSHANLSRANLSHANLSRASFCGANLDGAILDPDDIGGPGWILCALTEDEWELIEKGRKVPT